MTVPFAKNLHENNSRVTVTFRLGTLETEIVTLVKQLCEPLFILFDFASFQDVIYQIILAKFALRKFS